VTSAPCAVTQSATFSARSPDGLPWQAAVMSAAALAMLLSGAST
jgi:hypothetical protein